MKKKIKVILPGSYDPITVGHLEIIKRAAEEYEEVLAVGFINPDKTYFFSEKERLEMLKIATRGMENVECDFYSGLCVDYMRDHGAELIVKGYRNGRDYEYEQNIARWNKEHGGFDTVLWRCEGGFEDISSTAVRAAIENGDIDAARRLLPQEVANYIFEVALPRRKNDP